MTIAGCGLKLMHLVGQKRTILLYSYASSLKLRSFEACEFVSSLKTMNRRIEGFGANCAGCGCKRMHLVLGQKTIFCLLATLVA